MHYEEIEYSEEITACSVFNYMSLNDALKCLSLPSCYLREQFNPKAYYC